MVAHSGTLHLAGLPPCRTSAARGPENGLLGKNGRFSDPTCAGGTDSCRAILTPMEWVTLGAVAVVWAAVTYRQMVKAQEVLDAMLEGLKRDMLRFQAGRGD